MPYLRDGRSAYFVQQNRGKRSLCLDPRAPDGLAILKRLVEKVDVVVENFSPGAIARMGLGYPIVRELNPRAVMCSVSAFGQDGRLSALPGYDYIAQAYAGVTAMTGEADGPPCFPMLAMGDVATGIAGLAAIAIALLHRERTGKGQYLDVSLVDVYLNTHEINLQAASASRGAIRPHRAGSQHYAVAPLGIFRATQRYFFIVVLPHQWEPFARAIGRPELTSDPRFVDNAARLANVSALVAIIEDFLRSFGDDDKALRQLESARVPIAPILSIPEVLESEALRERRSLRDVEDPVLGTFTIPGMPLRFSDHPEPLPLSAPFLGEHNAEVLGELLGYDAARIRALEAAGVLHREPMPGRPA
jgi:crotonobetainyl-CoA:carnitine CoA-transferase CaiB-like acyl-CoA transferase